MGLGWEISEQEGWALLQKQGVRMLGFLGGGSVQDMETWDRVHVGSSLWLPGTRPCSPGVPVLSFMTA